MSSSHSRSSSELLSYQYIDVLPVFFKSFKLNFDFDDVKDAVQDIFTKDEYQLIISEYDEERQLIRLFTILCSNEELAIKFLDKIKLDYNFLTEAIKKERDSPTKNTISYIDTVHIWRGNNPKHTDFDVLRMDYHLPLRNALRKLQPCHYVGLQGDLGIGKKWLTINVCYDYDVMKAMNFQILWLDVNDCNSSEQDLKCLQTLRLILDGVSLSHSPTFSSSPNGSCNPIYQKCEQTKYNESISNRKQQLQQYLRKKFSMPEHRHCLLILNGVQNLKTVQTFNLGCKLLVITRYKKVSESLSSKMTTHLSVDSGLTKAEFFALFEKYLNQSRERFPKQAIEIYEHTQGHPYLLSIIAQNMRQHRLTWNEWIHNLKNVGITDDKFTKIVEISLNVLNAELLELYAVFSIFPHSVPIPVNLLAALWNKSNHDGEQIVQHFYKFSLIIKMPCNPTTQENLIDNEDDMKFCCCMVPFIYSSHLQTSKKMKTFINSQVNLHIKVIEYYKLHEVLNKRTEIELCDNRHDWYFFAFIGYHLQASGRHQELFPLIYWDFGFLEQKIRAVGLSNTISDLKHFEKEITNNDHRQQDRLAELREFLPKIEEKLTFSRDTSLLQYALMSSGAVYEAAKMQVRHFTQRVWFSERGNFHKRRQIVHLENQAKSLRFLDQDLCLIALANNDMLLLDISLECSSEPIILQNDGPKNSAAIIEARLFSDNNFVLTLDTSGSIKVWSIAEEQRRSLVYRRSSRQKVHAFNPVTHKSRSGKRYKQLIQENAMGQNGHITAFYIEQSTANRRKDTMLHIAFSNGEISVFKWNRKSEEFANERIPILKTGANDIRFICKLLDTYYMLISKSGDIAFWNLRDSSKSFVPFEWQVTSTGPLSYEVYDSANATRVIIIFADKIISLIFRKKAFNQQPDADVKTIYENRLDALKSPITCAKLSPDEYYLVVGTKCGLIVYDMESESEVLRSNVSESIACLDIFALDDKIYKYVIICGSDRRRCLNILAVRKNGEQGITWAHNVTSMGNEASSGLELEPDVWLIGHKLYDVYYKHDGSTQLVAVDSKNRVHQVNTTKTKAWYINDMNRETVDPITAITTGSELAFVGYNNGEIFNISKQTFEASPMKAPITYLQIFDETHLVASTNEKTSVRYLISNNGTELNIRNYGLASKKCYKIFGHYLLLINEHGFLLLIDLNRTDNDCKVYSGLPEPHLEKLCCSDYQNDHLVLATATSITIWKYHCKNETEKMPAGMLVYSQAFTPNGSNNTISNNLNERPQATISAVALSKDARLIAFGLTNGDIELHKIHEKGIDYFNSLKSHRTRVNDMKFSLGNEVLASCAEQLCIWSVTYLLNNPMQKDSPKRRSSRFSSQRSTDFEEVDARVVNSCGSNGGLSCNGNSNHNFLNVPNGAVGVGVQQYQNQHLDTATHVLQLEEAARIATAKAWCDKRGPVDKEELLSCIKFDGNKAEKLFVNPAFTQFNTIDNEGVFYHLELLNVADSDETANIDRCETLESSATSFNGTINDTDCIDTIHYVNHTSYRASIDDTDDLPVGEDDVYI